MKFTATQYKIADLTDMMIPTHVPAGTKVIVKLQVSNPNMDVMSVLIRNGGWQQSDSNTMTAWCVSPAEVDARRDGLERHFDRTGSARS